MPIFHHCLSTTNTGTAATQPPKQIPTLQILSYPSQASSNALQVLPKWPESRQMHE